MYMCLDNLHIHVYALSVPSLQRLECPRLWLPGPSVAQVLMARTAALGPASLLSRPPPPLPGSSCLSTPEANWDAPKLRQLVLDGNFEA